MSKKQFQVVEPSVIRLTSDETRALMQIALSAGPIGCRYGGKGIVDLGLVKPVRSPQNKKAVLKAEILALRKKLGGNYKAISRLVAEIQKKEQDLRYAGKSEQLYALTEAGRSLVKTITIRRR